LQQDASSASALSRLPLTGAARLMPYAVRMKELVDAFWRAAA
jgi:hypothetical protein